MGTSSSPVGTSSSGVNSNQFVVPFDTCGTQSAVVGSFFAGGTSLFDRAPVLLEGKISLFTVILSRTAFSVAGGTVLAGFLAVLAESSQMSSSSSGVGSRIAVFSLLLSVVGSSFSGVTGSHLGVLAGQFDVLESLFESSRARGTMTGSFLVVFFNLGSEFVGNCLRTFGVGRMASV